MSLAFWLTFDLHIFPSPKASDPMLTGVLMSVYKSHAVSAYISEAEFEKLPVNATYMYIQKAIYSLRYKHITTKFNVKLNVSLSQRITVLKVNSNRYCEQ